MDTFLKIVALLADVATIVAAIGILGVFQSMKADRVRAWHQVNDVYMKDMNEEERAQVFRHYDTGLHFSQWPPDDQRIGERLCRVLEVVCFYEKHLGEVFWQSYGYPIGKAFLLLEPAVNATRIKDGWPDKWNNFVRIGRLALVRYSELRQRPGNAGNKDLIER